MGKGRRVKKGEGRERRGRGGERRKRRGGEESESRWDVHVYFFPLYQFFRYVHSRYFDESKPLNVSYKGRFHDIC